MTESLIRWCPPRHRMRNSTAAAGLLAVLSALPALATARHETPPPAADRLGVVQASFDLKRLKGLPVYAINPGRVRFAGYQTGLGQTIDIDQPNGFSTRYAHLNRLLVHPGQTVTLHQEIGLVADTGWALWPHLLSDASGTALSVSKQASE